MKAIVELHWLEGARGHGKDKVTEVEMAEWRRSRTVDWNGRIFEHCATRPDGVWVYRDNSRP